jgi:hypothetical protein
MEENADAIGLFEEITLQFGIDSTKFQIEWLEKLRAKISSKETGV